MRRAQWGPCSPTYAIELDILSSVDEYCWQLFVGAQVHSWPLFSTQVYTLALSFDAAAISPEVMPLVGGRIYSGNLNLTKMQNCITEIEHSQSQESFELLFSIFLQVKVIEIKKYQLHCNYCTIQFLVGVGKMN